MRKIVASLMTIFIMLNLTACGSIFRKVSVKSDSIEIGTVFDENNQFECKDGVTINLKEGYSVDTSKIGEVSAVFVICAGEKIEEKEFKFKVVDTEAPKIEANNISVYVGRDFDPATYAICTDNSGENVVASVRSNNVDITTPGNYTVVYEAKDSAGNSSEQTVNVNVISLETAEDVMDLIDEYLCKNGYTEFSYNKNAYDAVFVHGPAFASYKLNSDRTLDIYPEIYILEDIFSSQFKVSSILFRMELTDRGPQSSRYDLVADKFVIKSGDTSISTVFDGIPTTGDFETSYYKSKFHYQFSGEDVETLNQMLNSENIVFDIQPKNQISDFSTFPIKTTYQTVPISYSLGNSDIDNLKQTVAIYNDLLEVFGQYGQ